MTNHSHIWDYGSHSYSHVKSLRVRTTYVKDLEFLRKSACRYSTCKTPKTPINKSSKQKQISLSPILSSGWQYQWCKQPHQGWWIAKALQRLRSISWREWAAPCDNVRSCFLMCKTINTPCISSTQYSYIVLALHGSGFLLPALSWWPWWRKVPCSLFIIAPKVSDEHADLKQLLALGYWQGLENLLLLLRTKVWCPALKGNSQLSITPGPGWPNTLLQPVHGLCSA